VRARLSVRLALVAAVSVLVAVLVFTFAANALIADRAIDRVDRSLGRTAAQVVDDLERPGGGDPVAPDSQAAPGADPLTLPPGTRVQIDPVGTREPGGPETVRLEGERFRMLVTAAPPAADGTPRTVSVARPVGDVEQVLDEVTLALGLAAVVAAIAALALALLVGRRALRPLTRFRIAAERVAASQDPSMRVTVGRPDEVGRLARALNRMLARLEEAQARLRSSLAAQRRFSADASHELRTPLTALRGDLDLLREYPLPDDERAAVLDEMAQAVDRMDATVTGLLGLARSEAGASDRERIALPELLGTLSGGPDASLEVAESADGAAVVGSPDLVRAALGNLVENGRRHGDHVTVELSVENGEVVVRVSDDGPGVAPEDHVRVFDRFYRAPALRAKPGSGLGLSIARAAAESMGGSVDLLDAGPGAVFEARLPLAAAAEEQRPEDAERPADSVRPGGPAA